MSARLLLPLPCLFAACERSEAPRGSPPGQVDDPAYVEDATCAGCHAEELERFRGSHHDRAMEVATPETVLADFDGARFEHHGVETTFRRDGARFFVRTNGPDGELAEYEVLYTFGVEPLQQYVVAFPGGKLQCLTVAWDTIARRWFHLYEEPIPHDDPLHWTGRLQSWNAMCAECHSTGLVKGYDAASDTYRTTWRAIDVGCQACHGPGRAHVDWANGKRGGDATLGLSVRLQRGDAATELAVCAACHSRRSALADGFEPGASFLDQFQPALLREGLYHADGQIDGEVYEWGSFAQSRMHAAGVGCSDCHDPHGLELFAPGDAVCLQCHVDTPPLERFPTLRAKRYDSVEHHHHDPAGEGARCVSCHMPAKTYMVVDPRRDHSFRVPRPDLSVELGTPNACGTCHVEGGAEWAAEQVAAWFPESKERPHFARALARARAGKPDAPAELLALVRDAEVPSIARATALEQLRELDPGSARATLFALADADPLVRATAARGLDALPAGERAAAGATLLEDPVRAVRAEAGRAFCDLPAETLPALPDAIAAYVAAQLASGDLPGPHLNLGAMAESRGDVERALAEYLRALELLPAFLPARYNLATLYNLLGRKADAERVLREGIRLVPEEGDLHYSLGLLLAEEERLAEASSHLSRAAELLPERARVHYNAGLAHQHLGRAAQAEESLERAHELAPNDLDVLRALVITFVDRELWDEARLRVDKLLALAPNDEWALAARAEIEGR